MTELHCTVIYSHNDEPTICPVRDLETCENSKFENCPIITYSKKRLCELVYCSIDNLFDLIQKYNESLSKLNNFSSVSLNETLAMPNDYYELPEVVNCTDEEMMPEAIEDHCKAVSFGFGIAFSVFFVILSLMAILCYFCGRRSALNEVYPAEEANENYIFN